MQTYSNLVTKTLSINTRGFYYAQFDNSDMNTGAYFESQAEVNFGNTRIRDEVENLVFIQTA